MIPFLEKVEENLQVAEWCLKNQHTNAGANRIYYAMYQAALAALIHYDYASAREDNKHDWVQSEFAKRLVKRQKTYPRLQGYLMEALELRNKADYQEQAVSRKKAERLLKKARHFYNTIREDLA